MVISNDLSSIGYNTFGIDVSFGTFIELTSKSDLPIIRNKILESGYFILGGGSNILLSQDISKPVIQVNNKGIELIKDAEEYILVKLAAGESWHEVVLWSVEHGYGGIENLSLIPGKCGAAPMQNIGAYGVEIKDVIHAVIAYKLADGHEYTFHGEECGFGYRTSNFKTKWKDDFIITDIVLKLSKPGFHKLNTSYGAIESELQQRGISQPTIDDISKVVISIRQAKLPYPEQIGNAGSFFKNPVVSDSAAAALLEQYPQMPSYPQPDQCKKIPAAWLIDQCGFKGVRRGSLGVHKNQALVLVNYLSEGGGTGAQLLALAEELRDAVWQRFSIRLEIEPRVYGLSGQG